MSQVSQAYSIWNYYKIHKNDCIIAINDVPTDVPVNQTVNEVQIVQPSTLSYNINVYILY